MRCVMIVVAFLSTVGTGLAYAEPSYGLVRDGTWLYTAPRQSASRARVPQSNAAPARVVKIVKQRGKWIEVEPIAGEPSLHCHNAFNLLSPYGLRLFVRRADLTVLRGSCDAAKRGRPVSLPNAGPRYVAAGKPIYWANGRRAGKLRRNVDVPIRTKKRKAKRCFPLHITFGAGGDESELTICVRAKDIVFDRKKADFDKKLGDALARLQGPRSRGTGTLTKGKGTGLGTGTRPKTVAPGPRTRAQIGARAAGGPEHCRPARAHRRAGELGPRRRGAPQLAHRQRDQQRQADGQQCPGARRQPLRAAATPRSHRTECSRARRRESRACSGRRRSSGAARTGSTRSPRGRDGPSGSCRRAPGG